MPPLEPDGTHASYTTGKRPTRGSRRPDSGAVWAALRATMPLLAGKIAIVTGAASGIGRAGAQAFAAAGATVVVADINEQGGERVAEEIGGGRAQFQSVDVRDTRQVQRMAANTVARSGASTCCFTTR